MALEATSSAETRIRTSLIFFSHLVAFIATHIFIDIGLLAGKERERGGKRMKTKEEWIVGLLKMRAHGLPSPGREQI